MKTRAFTSFALAGILAAGAARADVTVSPLIIRGDDAYTIAWQKTFAPAKKGTPADENAGAALSQDSISSGEFGKGVPTVISDGECLVQSFAGDGKRLAVVGVFLGSIPDKVDFELTVTDYGETAPRTITQLKKGSVICTEKGTLAKSGTGGQYYFSLTKIDAAKLSLKTENTYGIKLVLKGQSKPINVFRSTKAEAYSKGISATSSEGTLKIIKVGESDASFRKLNFAIYTK